MVDPLSALGITIAIVVLQEAHDILRRRYGSISMPTLLPSDLSLTSEHTRSIAGLNIAPEGSIQHARKVNRSPLLMVRWSFRDKKRVQTIIARFGELNSGIHEHVKLLCLASSIGIDFKHLEHLQEDENSRTLGFDVDATLRITTGHARELPGTLELSDEWDKQLTELPTAEHFTVFQQHGNTFLREIRPYGGRNPQVARLDPLYKSRVDALAKLLHQPKEIIFRIPRCIGWRYLEIHKAISFVFEVPLMQCVKPTSLLNLVTSSTEKPSLGSKFHLAHGLANCLAQLHMVKWLHESFCSDNVLFFPQERVGHATVQQETPVDYSQSWVLGFDLSRPEGELSLGPTELYPERDVYRHPDRQGQVRMQFTKLHDIYALGVVLLEIGLWAPAVSLQSNRFASARSPRVLQDQLIKQADRRLSSHLGSKYRDLVLKCLKGDFRVMNDTKDDLKLQQAFRSQVVEVLKKAADNV